MLEARDFRKSGKEDILWETGEKYCPTTAEERREKKPLPKIRARRGRRMHPPPTHPQEIALAVHLSRQLNQRSLILTDALAPTRVCECVCSFFSPSPLFSALAVKVWRRNARAQEANPTEERRMGEAYHYHRDLKWMRERVSLALRPMGAGGGVHGGAKRGHMMRAAARFNLSRSKIGPITSPLRRQERRRRLF